MISGGGALSNVLPSPEKEPTVKGKNFLPFTMGLFSEKTWCAENLQNVFSLHKIELYHTN